MKALKTSQMTMNRLKLTMKISILAIMSMCAITGCMHGKPATTGVELNMPSYFIKISDEALGIVIYDTRTGVQYWCSKGSYNNGTLTMLYDTDGTPLIYESAEKKEG